MKRRAFLNGLALTAVSAGAGFRLPFANAAEYEGKLFAFVQADGGWDPTSFCDPKTNTAGERVINNAGISISGLTTSVLDEDVETVRKTMETNTLGPLSIIQKLAPLMQGEGRIVNVSSHMGQLSDMGNNAVAYRISKTAFIAGCMSP